MKLLPSSTYPSRNQICSTSTYQIIYVALLAMCCMLPNSASAQTTQACMFNDSRNLHLDLNHWVKYGRIEHVSDSIGSDAADNYADDNGTYVNISGRACPVANVEVCPPEHGQKAIFLRGRFNRDNSGTFEGFDQRYHILKPAAYDKTERRSWSGGVNDTRNSKVVVSGYSDDAGPAGIDGCDEDVRVHATLWRDLWNDTAPYQGNASGGRVKGIDIDKHSFAFGLSNFNADNDFVVTGMEVASTTNTSTDAAVESLTNPERALLVDSEGFYYKENIITGAYEFRPLNAILGAVSSQTRDANDDFFVVGSLKKSNGDIRAFVYDPLWDAANDGTSRAKLTANVVELPPLPGDTESYAMSINDYFISTSPYLAGGYPYSGQIFGFSVRYVDGVKRIRAAAWNPDFDVNNEMTYTAVDLLKDWPTTGDPTTSTPDSAIFAANSFGMAVGFRTKPNQYDPNIMVRYAMLYRDGQDKIVDLNRSSTFRFEYEPTDTQSFLQSATAVSDSGLTAAGGTGTFDGVTHQYSFIQTPVYFQTIKLPSTGSSYVGKIAKMSNDGTKAVGCTFADSFLGPDANSCQKPLLLASLPTVANRYSTTIAGNGGATSGQAVGMAADGMSAVGKTPNSVKWSLSGGLPSSSTGISMLSAVNDISSTGVVVGKRTSGTYQMGSACATAACSTYADLTNPKSALNPAGTWKYESEPKAINGLNIVGGYYRDKDITGASNYHAALWNISLSGNNSITLPTPSGANPNKPSAVLGVSNRSDGMQFAVGYVSKTDGTQVAAEWAASSTNLSAAIGTIAQPNGSLNSVLQSVNSSGQSVGRLRRPYSLKVIYPGGGSSGDEDLAFMYDFNRSTIDGYQPGDEYQLVRNLAAPNDGILMAVRAVAINDATEIIIYGYGMDGEDGYWKLIPPPSFTEVGLLAPKNFACDPIPEYPAQPDPPTSWPPLPPATESPDSALGGLDIVGLGLLAAAYKIRRRRKA